MVIVKTNVIMSYYYYSYTDIPKKTAPQNLEILMAIVSHMVLRITMLHID